MADGYQRFLDFDWSDKSWEEYLKNLYPPPNQRQITKFKKKWYKKNVDPGFDDTYEPPAPAAPHCAEERPVTAAGSSGSTSGTSREGSAPPVPPGGFLPAAYNDGSKWRKMGLKATICANVYAIAMIFAIGSFSGVLPPFQALLVLIAAFALEILAKYGLKFNSTYVQSVLLDDVGMMPIVSLTLLMPGMHRTIRIFALVAPFLTAVLSFCQICKAHAKIPAAIRDFFSPLADMAARYKVMQVRADVEVVLGVVLILGVFMLMSAPISPMLYWNFMILRYMTNPWTQHTFTRIDRVLTPLFGHIPGIRDLYARVKNSLGGFVDPSSKKAGKLCTVL